MRSKISERITISPPVWPGTTLLVQPGDLKIVVPQGLGISGPFPIRPWDKPFEDDPSDYYGLEAPSSHPMLNATKSEAAGGTVYFDDNVTAPDLEAVLRVLRIHGGERQYAAFLGDSLDSVSERYLTQLRIVTRFGLNYMFRAISREEYEAYPQQPLSVAEALWAFVEDQRQVWGSGFSFQLSGTLGGDGDWAKESLAFGLVVENTYQGVYRVWSRPWLVTK